MRVVFDVGCLNVDLAVIYRLGVHRKWVQLLCLGRRVQRYVFLSIQNHQEVMVRIVMQRRATRLDSHPEIHLSDRLTFKTGWSTRKEIH